MNDFRWTTIAKARDAGFEDALQDNWAEIETDHERVPLAIDWAAYRGLERAGATRLGVLRVDGRYVGHSVFFVQPTLHHRHSTWAINDLIWLRPEHRKGRAGVYMIREAERLLKAEGVQKVIYTAKVALDDADPRATLAKLLFRLGYSKVEEVWARFL